MPPPFKALLDVKWQPYRVIRPDQSWLIAPPSLNEMLESKRINIFLDSFGRKPANSTSIVDKLGARGAVPIEADGLHAHKKFRLTGQGRQEAMEIVGRLRRGTGGKFAVVG